MQSLCGFLGVDPAKLDESLMGERFNVSRAEEMPSAIRAHLERKYRPMMEKLAGRFPRIDELWGLG